MPPKKKEGKKAEKKKKEKILEDKTFGLKNKKKSKVVQKYVEQVKKQVDSMGSKKKTKNTAKEDKKAKKKAEEEAEREMAMLLGIPVSQVREQKKAKKPKVKGKPENAAPAGGEPAATAADGAGGETPAEEGNTASGAGEAAPAAAAVAPLPAAAVEEPEEEAWTQEKEIEAEREKLRAKQGGRGTPVTFEAFMRFKRDRDHKRYADMAKRKREEYKARGIKRFRTGREIFMQDPSLGTSNPAGGGDDADVDFMRSRKTRGQEEEENEEGLNELERLMRHTAGDGDALAARAAAMVASLDRDDVAQGAVDKDLFMEGDEEEDDDLDDLLEDEEEDTPAEGGGGGNGDGNAGGSND